MRTITKDEALAALQATVEAHPGRSNAGCTYLFDDDTPNCIIGTTLVEQFGVSPSFFRGRVIRISHEGGGSTDVERNNCRILQDGLQTTLHDEVHLQFTPDALMLLREVQRAADSREAGRWHTIVNNEKENSA